MNVPGSLKHSADSADTTATAELEVSARHGDGGAGGDDGDSDGAGGDDGEDSDRCGSPGYLPRHSEVGDGSQLVHMEPDNDPVQEEPAQSPQSSPEPSPEPSPRFKQSIKSIYQDIHKTQLLTCLYIMSRV